MKSPVTRIVDLEVIAVDLEIAHLKLVMKFLLPLANKSGWCDQQNASKCATVLQRREQHPDLDRLTESHIIRNEPIQVSGRENVVHEMYLMGERVNV